MADQKVDSFGTAGVVVGARELGGGGKDATRSDMGDIGGDMERGG